jgi:proteic killer suppression protein
VIKSFAHKGLEGFFLTGSKRGIQPAHAVRLQLAALHRSRRPQDMGLPNWRLHPLKGDPAGHRAVWISGNWRLTFKFDGEDAIDVNYLDYH